MSYALQKTYKVYQPYSEKLKTPAWQKRRLEVFKKDGWKCTVCHNDKIELQVHHLDYISGFDPWEYPDDMLITLCSICHDKERNREHLEKNLATTLKMKGFLTCDLLALSCKIDTDPKFCKALLNKLREYE